MKIKYILGCAGLLIAMSGHAQQCQIDRMTSSQLQLNASTQTRSALSFKVNCDLKYAIQFRTRNAQGTSGKSYLTNGRLGRLQTQMNISGGSGSHWGAPMTQSGLDQYIVTVQLVEKPTALTPAGDYTDDLYISLFF
ncbi:hypothetical protein [Acinetobacter sp.]|jgi:hypothetical protein|uniref:hypothetical protein n=1 Tax=Acinetobacter sp. TaxID=472 RepID=UPI0035B1D72C